MKAATKLNVIGLTLALLVLLTCGSGVDPGIVGVFLFAVAMLILVVGAIITIWKGHFVYGSLMIALITALMIASYKPWYAPHYVPWGPDGGSTHWHIIWELGHVH